MKFQTLSRIQLTEHFLRNYWKYFSFLKSCSTFSSEQFVYRVDKYSIANYWHEVTNSISNRIISCSLATNRLHYEWQWMNHGMEISHPIPKLFWDWSHLACAVLKAKYPLICENFSSDIQVKTDRQTESIQAI